jgi:hypothetical protein
MNGRSAAKDGNLIGSAPDWYPAAIMGYARHLAAYRADVVQANAVAPDGRSPGPLLAGRHFA